jgi:hypothetical protein
MKRVLLDEFGTARFVLLGRVQGEIVVPESLSSPPPHSEENISYVFTCVYFKCPLSNVGGDQHSGGGLHGASIVLFYALRAMEIVELEKLRRDFVITCAKLVILISEYIETYIFFPLQRVPVTVDWALFPASLVKTSSLKAVPLCVTLMDTTFESALVAVLIDLPNAFFLCQLQHAVDLVIARGNVFFKHGFKFRRHPNGQDLQVMAILTFT